MVGPPHSCHAFFLSTTHSGMPPLLTYLSMAWHYPEALGCGPPSILHPAQTLCWLTDWKRQNECIWFCFQILGPLLLLFLTCWVMAESASPVTSDCTSLHQTIFFLLFLVFSSVGIPPRMWGPQPFLGSPVSCTN